jgi:hypothetical protein
MQKIDTQTQKVIMGESFDRWKDWTHTRKALIGRYRRIGMSFL